MSTPIVVGGIYAHRSLFGVRHYRLLAVTEDNVVLRPVMGQRRLPFEDTLNHFTDGCYRLVVDRTSDEEYLQVAEVLGVVVVEVTDDQPVPYRLDGEQPAVEFTDGPATHGPLWTDEHLARVFFGGETA